jgi:hypothetical protein
VRDFLDALVRRRAALLERSAAQRGQIAAAAADLRRGATQPLLLGLGVAATLLTSSPKLRGWMVRAWAAYAFVRRLLLLR